MSLTPNRIFFIPKLGDETFVANKLQSYAHSLNCHSHEIFDKDGKIDINVIKEYIRSGKSIFSNVSLKLDNDIELLSSVEKLRHSSPEYFL